MTIVQVSYYGVVSADGHGQSAPLERFTLRRSRRDQAERFSDLVMIGLPGRP
jgi:hypothetical protein